MILINLLYLSCYLLIWWGYCGYPIFLFFLSRPKLKSMFQKINSKNLASYLSITILVPYFNEEKFIKAKFGNLLKLKYPEDKLQILFLDGNSTDSTSEILGNLINKKGDKRIELVRTNRSGKIHQLNYILPQIKSDIIVNADVDSSMEQDTLIKIADAFQNDKEIGVVGAFVTPLAAPPPEIAYWNSQNRIRILESCAHSSSIVTAPCYSFRNGMIKKFPQDTIADDIFISFQANIKGYKTLYLSDAIVYEKRNPHKIWELIKHKFRKGNAFLKELFRFLPKINQMNMKWFIIYSNKFLQFFIIPWLLILFTVLTVYLLLKKEYSIILLLSALGMVSLFITHNILMRVKIPKTKMESNSIFLTLVPFLGYNALLLLVALSYPFFKQTTIYRKVKKKRKRLVRT